MHAHTDKREKENKEQHCQTKFIPIPIYTTDKKSTERKKKKEKGESERKVTHMSRSEGSEVSIG